MQGLAPIKAIGWLSPRIEPSFSVSWLDAGSTLFARKSFPSHRTEIKTLVGSYFLAGGVGNQTSESERPIFPKLMRVKVMTSMPRELTSRSILALCNKPARRGCAGMAIGGNGKYQIKTACKGRIAHMLSRKWTAGFHRDETFLEWHVYCKNTPRYEVFVLAIAVHCSHN